MDTSNFKYLLPNAVEFRSFLDVYAKKTNEIVDTDHVAFLLYRLCCHVACCKSKKVIKAYQGLAIALYQKTKVSISPFILLHIFKGMHDLVALEGDEPFRSARGSIWMVQI